MVKRRVRCKWCKKMVFKRKDGKLRVHRESTGLRIARRGPICMLSETPN